MSIIDRYDKNVDGHLFESDTGKLVYYYHYEVLKQQYEGVFQAFKNVCNQRDQREAQNAELLAQISNMYDCIFMADDNAAGHGYDADSSIRRHLGYAMTIANKAKAGEKQ